MVATGNADIWAKCVLDFLSLLQASCCSTASLGTKGENASEIMPVSQPVKEVSDVIFLKKEWGLLLDALQQCFTNMQMTPNSISL